MDVSAMSLLALETNQRPTTESQHQFDGIGMPLYSQSTPPAGTSTSPQPPIPEQAPELIVPSVLELMRRSPPPLPSSERVNPQQSTLSTQSSALDMLREAGIVDQNGAILRPDLVFERRLTDRQWADLAPIFERALTEYAQLLSSDESAAVDVGSTGVYAWVSMQMINRFFVTNPVSRHDKFNPPVTIDRARNMNDIIFHRFADQALWNTEQPDSGLQGYVTKVPERAEALGVPELRRSGRVDAATVRLFQLTLLQGRTGY